MSWLIKLLSPWKSELFAIVGVLAVAGIGTAVISYFYTKAQARTIEAQRDTIELQAQTNDQWARNWETMSRVRQIEQQSALDLQAQLALIAQDNDAMATSIKELEATSAETRDYLRNRIPDDLRRLLSEK